MKLIEAFEICRRPVPEEAQALHIGLVCGFLPLHLNSFLTARLRLQLPGTRIAIDTGLYGDFAGNLARLEKRNADAGIVQIEWADLDARLGLRSLGSWSPSRFADILENVKARCTQIGSAMARISSDLPLVVSLPTLPFPLISYTPPAEAGSLELQIRFQVASLGALAAGNPNVRVVNAGRLDLVSPLAERYDLDSDLRSGFPYKVAHASALSGMLVDLLQPAAPKKALITDLDDTLWKGLLGEVGADGVSWDLDHHSQMHGAYQRLVHALADSGVLVGVASKNDASFVEEALKRKDILVPASAIFPIEANWGRKSDSVARILTAWNIGADSVVFLDDSPMELAEVHAKFPQMECLRFPAGDDPAILELMKRLRELFGKSRILEEDQLRLESLRRGNESKAAAAEFSGSPDEFFEQAEARITLDYEKTGFDPRALELVNKTNQFNLNGKRHSEASWRAYLKNPGAFLLVVSYEDKYGSLGKIAVLAGRQEGKRLRIDHWVMSCRAFSRRIEHRCLESLLARFEVDSLEFDFLPTAKNGPLRSFLEEVSGKIPEPGDVLSREAFLERRPKMFHQVQELTNG